MTLIALPDVRWGKGVSAIQKKRDSAWSEGSMGKGRIPNILEVLVVAIGEGGRGRRVGGARRSTRVKYPS